MTYTRPSIQLATMIQNTGMNEDMELQCITTTMISHTMSLFTQTTGSTE